VPEIDPILSFTIAFAENLTEKFASTVIGQPEDQLKSPTEQLLKSIAKTLHRSLVAKTESAVSDIGRPDLGIALDGLLSGHIELKAPGTGANPRLFTGHDKDQWERFKRLPNLVYTDGNEWALYRTGKKVADLVRFPGDVRTDGAAAVDAQSARNLLNLVTAFFAWTPIVPHNPKELAAVLAPLCRLLRETVHELVQNSTSALYQLLLDWRNYLFPNADEEQFADAYAQTVVYAMLLAHLDGLVAVDTSSATKQLAHDHNLLSHVLRVLADPLARAEIETAVSVLERCISAVDVRKLSRAGDPWIYFYEDFLAAYDPDLRRNRGVYYTPAEVVECQVALASDVLRNELGKQRAFSDPSVVVLRSSCRDWRLPARCNRKCNTRYRANVRCRDRTADRHNPRGFSSRIRDFGRTIFRRAFTSIRTTGCPRSRISKRWDTRLSNGYASVPQCRITWRFTSTVPSVDGRIAKGAKCQAEYSRHGVHREPALRS